MKFWEKWKECRAVNCEERSSTAAAIKYINSNGLSAYIHEYSMHEYLSRTNTHTHTDIDTCRYSPMRTLFTKLCTTQKKFRVSMFSVLWLPDLSLSHTHRGSHALCDYLYPFLWLSPSNSMCFKLNQRLKRPSSPARPSGLPYEQSKTTTKIQIYVLRREQKLKKKKRKEKKYIYTLYTIYNLYDNHYPYA